MSNRTDDFTDKYKSNNACKEILSSSGSSEYLQMCGRGEEGSIITIFFARNIKNMNE